MLGTEAKKHNPCFCTSLRRSCTLRALNLGQEDNLCPSPSPTMQEEFFGLGRDVKLLEKAFCLSVDPLDPPNRALFLLGWDENLPDTFG